MLRFDENRALLGSSIVGYREKKAIKKRMEIKPQHAS